MINFRSKWTHRLFGAGAVLGISSVVYADHCWDLQLHENDCGTSQVVYGNDCSYWTEGPSSVFVSCPNQLLHVDTAANVHICIGGQATGSTGCVTCDDDKVEATRQWYRCQSGTCTVIEDGAPVVLEECCTADLTGTPCGH